MHLYSFQQCKLLGTDRDLNVSLDQRAFRWLHPLPCSLLSLKLRRSLETCVRSCYVHQGHQFDVSDSETRMGGGVFRPRHSLPVAATSRQGARGGEAGSQAISAVQVPALDCNRIDSSCRGSNIACATSGSPTHLVACCARGTAGLRGANRDSTGRLRPSCKQRGAYPGPVG